VLIVTVAPRWGFLQAAGLLAGRQERFGGAAVGPPNLVPGQVRT
jgi:hypothetical protein